MTDQSAIKMPKTPLLDTIETPADLRELSKNTLSQVARELRDEVISAVSVTGGHLGSSLGVVELTVALHYVFDTPHDRLIWDVSHQSYPHKVLTGRRNRIRTLRQEGGLSGFTKREESAYDPFGAGHSSTSISAGMGMAVARKLSGDDGHIVSIIGDGAMSAGMAYEALNNAVSAGACPIVILNHNDMSIAPPVGAMGQYLNRLATEIPVGSLKAQEETFFTNLGFAYAGPINGHDLDQLLPVLENARDEQSGPVLIHVVTEKGKGYAHAESSEDKFHGVGSFDVKTGAQSAKKSNTPTYTKIFANALIREAAHDDKIVGITAAMPSGTGMDLFEQAYPTRAFDVGIAEQHAVTFAAGLACEGYKPFCALYSTFLQRAYDQVVHDVAIQKLPVRFAIDRAGYVGADGATHAGAFDTTFLATLPNFIVMAPSDEIELIHMVATAVTLNDQPCSFRYPRGEGIGLTLPETPQVLDIGKGRIVREGERVAILTFGTSLHQALGACEELEEHGIKPTIADARFAKPLDKDLVRQLAKHHDTLITVEEGSIGGFGSHVLTFLADDGLLDQGLKVRTMTMPDRFIDHAKPASQLGNAHLDTSGIVAKVLGLLGKK